MWWTSRSVRVSQSSQYSARSRFDQLVVGGCCHRPDVGERGGAFSFEWDPAEAGDQRLLPLLAFDRDL
jgi:hypothetical protein